MDARVELQAEIDAPREVVFSLVSTAEGLARWLDEADSRRDLGAPSTCGCWTPRSTARSSPSMRHSTSASAGTIQPSRWRRRRWSRSMPSRMAIARTSRCATWVSPAGARATTTKRSGDSGFHASSKPRTLRPRRSLRPRRRRRRGPARRRRSRAGGSGPGPRRRRPSPGSRCGPRACRPPRPCQVKRPVVMPLESAGWDATCLRHAAGDGWPRTAPRCALDGLVGDDVPGRRAWPIRDPQSGSGSKVSGVSDSLQDALDLEGPAGRSLLVPADEIQRVGQGGGLDEHTGGRAFGDRPWSGRRRRRRSRSRPRGGRPRPRSACAARA